MKVIELQNERLKTLLSNITKIFYSDKMKEFTSKAKEINDKLIKEYHPTSDEYLYEAFKLKLEDFDYPRASHGLGLTNGNYAYDSEGLVLNEVSRMGSFLGIQRNALVMSYPDNGYIGWHHNGNAPGNNILFSYSQDGDGGFSYWDYKTKSIQVIKDKPGWNVKVGYYPDQKNERDRVYWHMAKTKKHRVSIAYVLPHRGMWKDMIEEITTGKYDKSVLDA